MPGSSVGAAVLVGSLQGMGVSETFTYLDRLPREQQLGFLSAALAEPHAELQLAAASRLLGGAHDRVDVVVERFLELLPVTRQQVDLFAEPLVRVAHGKLYSDLERHRQSAYAVLAELGGHAALEALAAGLTDSSPRVRDIVLRALSRDLRAFAVRCRTDAANLDVANLPKSPAWQALADTLRRYSAHRQSAFLDIAIELGQIGAPLASDVVFGGRDMYLQQMFAEALTTSTSPGAAELILALALGPSVQQQAAGSRVLRKRRDEAFARALPLALAKLGPERAPDVQRLGADIPWLELVVPTAGDLGGPDALRLLQLVAGSGLKPTTHLRLVEACQAHSDNAVRCAALQQMADLRGPESLAAISSALADPDPRTQLVAAQAIITMNPSDKVTLLTPLLGSPSEEVRRVAMREVSKVSFARYLQRFDQMDPKLQQNAARTLAKVDPLMMERLADEIAALDAVRRLKALRIVELLGAEDRLRDSLLELLHDGDHRVRATAIRIVDCSGSVEAMRVLVDALSDRDRRVRANAIEALEQLDDVQFVPLLVPFLEDPDNRVRANAAKALCVLGAKVAHPHVADAQRTLLRMLNHDTEPMRLSAAWALGLLGFDGAAEALEARAAVEGSRHVVARLRKSLDGLRQPQGGAV